MEYVLPLMPETGFQTRRVTTLHLSLAFTLGSLGLCCMLLYMFTASSHIFSTAYWYSSLPAGFRSANTSFAIFGACALAAATGIAVTAIRRRDWLRVGRRNAMLRFIEVILLVLACALFARAQQKFPAAIFGVLALFVSAVGLWEMRSQAAPLAIMNESGVRLPKGGFTKSYSWKEIETIRLRHGILSVELSGNRLVQRSLRDEAQFDGEAVEAFCRLHAARHEQARAAANAW